MDYDLVGNEGKIIFFLHGWGGDKKSFYLVKNNLIEKSRMVFVSFPGFGESPPPNKDYCVDDYMNDLLQLILNVAKGEKVCIVCHSFGARVSAKLCALYPELIDKLFIVDGAGLKPKRSIKYYIKVYKYKKLKKKFFSGKINNSKLENYGSEDYKLLPGNMKRTFVNVVNEDLKDYFKKIRAKTFIFWGDKDKETPLYMAKKLNIFIKKSKLLIIKNAGHFSYIDNMNVFIKSLNDFLF